jgi:hypothetical protein
MCRAGSCPGTARPTGAALATRPITFPPICRFAPVRDLLVFAKDLFVAARAAWQGLCSHPGTSAQRPWGHQAQRGWGRRARRRPWRGCDRLSGRTTIATAKASFAHACHCPHISSNCAFDADDGPVGRGISARALGVVKPQERDGAERPLISNCNLGCRGLRETVPSAFTVPSSQVQVRSLTCRLACECNAKGGRCALTYNSGE